MKFGFISLALLSIALLAQANSISLEAEEQLIKNLNQIQVTSTLASPTGKNSISAMTLAGYEVDKVSFAKTFNESKNTPECSIKVAMKNDNEVKAFTFRISDQDIQTIAQLAEKNKQLSNTFASYSEAFQTCDRMTR